MTSSHRGSRYNADRLSNKTHYALLNALTTIKGQAQMIERWAHRATVPDVDVIVQRLRSIDLMVGRMVDELDAIPAAPEPEDSPEVPDGSTNGAGPA